MNTELTFDDDGDERDRDDGGRDNRNRADEMEALFPPVAPPTKPWTLFRDHTLPDAWPAESDAIAEEFAAQDAALRRSKRIDVVCGVLLVLLLGGLISLTAGDLLFPVTLTVAVAAVLYIRLRSTPRRNAIAEIAARRVLIDPRCPQCGYALRHLCKMRCPECGRRVHLPDASQVRDALEGGRVSVSRGSVASDLGWLFGLIMIIAAMIAGKAFGAVAGWSAAALPPMVFLVFQAVTRRRQAARVPPFAVCDHCGESADLRINTCTHCAAPLMAEHVYVKPGLRGPSDPRLYSTRAQLGGGAAVALMLVINGLSYSRIAPGFGKVDAWFWPVQLVLLVVALVLLNRDLRLVRKDRLELFDHSMHPLCHRCLSSLLREPANGVCPACGESYQAIELAGGLRQPEALGRVG